MASDLPNLTNPQIPNTPREHTTHELPYRWGKFQGWLFLAGGSLGFLLLLFTDRSKLSRIDVYEDMAASIMSIPAGFGLLKKKIYGLMLFDAYLVYWCVKAIAEYLRFEITTPHLTLRVAIAALMAAYTNKRIREFS
jgi:hypothetical protein